MKDKRPPRDQRYRDKCFPGAAKEVFSPTQGGYAPLPYVSRELLRHLKGAELKVWRLFANCKATNGFPWKAGISTFDSNRQHSLA